MKLKNMFVQHVANNLTGIKIVHGLESMIKNPKRIIVAMNVKTTTP